MERFVFQSLAPGVVPDGVVPGVGNLPWDRATTDDDLSTAFAMAGAILPCVVQTRGMPGCE